MLTSGETQAGGTALRTREAILPDESV